MYNTKGSRAQRTLFAFISIVALLEHINIYTSRWTYYNNPITKYVELRKHVYTFKTYKCAMMFMF